MAVPQLWGVSQGVACAAGTLLALEYAPKEYSVPPVE